MLCDDIRHSRTFIFFSALFSSLAISQSRLKQFTFRYLASSPLKLNLNIQGVVVTPTFDASKLTRFFEDGRTVMNRVT